MNLLNDYRVKTLKTAFYLAGFDGVISYLFSKLGLQNNSKLLKVRANGIDEPFFIRAPSSDLLTYCQVFFDREYEFYVRRQPSVIVDAGANIGLASIYFATRFPLARIIAIEPEESNFQMLVKNTSNYSNVLALNAALWNENTEIPLFDHGLGSSGFMVSSVDNEKAICPKMFVKAMTMDRIMIDYGIEHIDILKVDIEGAEKEVFENPVLWVDQVDAFVVELHERLRPGCSESFNRAINDFPCRWHDGENIFVARNNVCIVPR